MRIVRALFALPALAVLIAGCGESKGPSSGSSNAVSRTVEVAMVDNAFQPTNLRVTKGETITFRFNNIGAVRHEGVVGDAATQDRHHDEMTASTGGGHGNSPGGAEHGGAKRSDGAVTVEPGKSGELTHTFDRDGTILIGCHEPGHWEAGMKVDISVL